MTLKTSLPYKLLCVAKWFLGSLFKGLFKRLRLTIQEHYEDARRGIETSPFVSFQNTRSSFKDGRFQDGEVYTATTYDKLKRLSGALRMGRDDVFFDLGAGKGRVVIFFAREKLKKIVGVELKEELAVLARQNVARIKGQTSVQIIQADALTVDLDEGTVFFLYNPFGLMTLIRVLDNIKATLENRPRNIRIVYFNALYADWLDHCDWLVKDDSLALDSEDRSWRSR